MTNKAKSVLVIFGKELPKKSKQWYRQFDKVLYQEETAQLTRPGSIHEASELVGKLARLETKDGGRLSKLINYKGYELWWMNCDTLYYRFCMPYTQYRDLLFYLKDFDKIYLFEPPYPDLFLHFSKAYRRECFLLKKFQLRRFLPVPFGVLLQVLLSLIFLPLLMIARPGLMIWVGDKFDHPHDYDFRMKFIYEELRKRKIPFVEFIRSLEKWPVVLRHAWKRKRPVFYSAAVVFLIHFFVDPFKKNKELIGLGEFSDPEQRFLFLVASHYLRNIQGTIWSIRAMRFIMRRIGVRVADISAGLGRNFHELLACKLNNIITIGIQHGTPSRYYFVSDFMPGFDGKNTLSVDKYGLWSEWWRDYYAKNSDAYKPAQLFVSGPMRPLVRKEGQPDDMPRQNKGKLRVLYISEEVAAPQEVLPYILTLLEAEDFELCFKFRPYRDEFEVWLKENQPELYEKILKTAKIFRSTMEEAVDQCDVTVGSYSTAVLEALLQLKPFIYCWTKKWGDCYDIKSSGFNNLFANTPQELIECIKRSREIPGEDLKKLQEQFFGNPYQNGSAWAVDQIEKYLW